MLDALVTGKGIVTDAGKDAFEFIGCYTGTYPGAAQQNPPLNLPGLDESPKFLGIVGIVHPFRRVGAQVNDPPEPNSLLLFGSGLLGMAENQHGHRQRLFSSIVLLQSKIRLILPCEG